MRKVSPEATKAVARAFARVAWPAFAVVVLTGFWNLTEVDVADTGHDVPDHAVRQDRARRSPVARRRPSTRSDVPSWRWRSVVRSDCWQAWGPCSAAICSRRALTGRLGQRLTQIGPRRLTHSTREGARHDHDRRDRVRRRGAVRGVHVGRRHSVRLHAARGWPVRTVAVPAAAAVAVLRGDRRPRRRAQRGAGRHRHDADDHRGLQLRWSTTCPTEIRPTSCRCSPRCRTTRAAPTRRSPRRSTTAVTTPPPSAVGGRRRRSRGVDEGYLPDDDAASRLNAYIQFACRDSQNNPGPSDTDRRRPRRPRRSPDPNELAQSGFRPACRPRAALRGLRPVHYRARPCTRVRTPRAIPTSRRS